MESKSLGKLRRSQRAGISLALLGTVLLYWGGSFVLGPTYPMTWAVLRDAAPKIYAPLLTVSFLLALVGYGTKAGLVPMHTWLPDAHSESPAPVSAMLSGALLNTAMLGIARFLGILNVTSVSRFAHTAVVVFGILSFVVAALFITRQTGVKRLMAYSSVEHLGVQALGLGFGGPLGIAGTLYHMLNHSLNKSLMFFGAGNAMRGYQTKEMHGMRRILKAFPVTGTLWLAGALAIAGAPPFGLFLSEFTILRAGVAGQYRWAVFLFLIFLIVVFIAFLAHFRRAIVVELKAMPSALGPPEIQQLRNYLRPEGKTGLAHQFSSARSAAPQRHDARSAIRERFGNSRVRKASQLAARDRHSDCVKDRLVAVRFRADSWVNLRMIHVRQR